MPTRRKSHRAGSSEPHHGVFTKDGETRTAASRAAAVRLRFDGWEETQPADAEALEAIEAATNPDD